MRSFLNHLYTHLGCIGIFVSVLIITALLFTPNTQGASIYELRERLSDQRGEVDRLEEEIAKHEREIAQARRQANTLEQEVEIIEQGVRHLTLQIDKTLAEIGAVEAEIETIKKEQEVTKERVTRQRNVLRELLRVLQHLDTDSVIEAFFKYPTLSQAITEVQAVYRTEQQAQDILGQLRILQTELSARENSFSDLQRELEGLQGRQEGQKQILEEQQVAKEDLIKLTREQEEELRKLRSQVADQHKQAEAEIARIDREIRAMLEAQGREALDTVGTLNWPINPGFGITCEFHCAGYPYQNVLGPHTGIDIRAPMGTPVRAAADGYVARVRAPVSPQYAYILIVHGDNISTVYGHLASVAVAEGRFVTRGQVIGGSGGAPGTLGAGLSTGPHLHFEVRQGGVPINPRIFLQ